MQGLVDKQSDFREAAVAESERMRRDLPVGVLVEKCDFSYCLPQRPDYSRLRSQIKITAVLGAILGIAGVAIGGIIGTLLKRHIVADDRVLLTVAGCCTVVGILAMFFPALREGRIVRQNLKQRVGTSNTSMDGNETHVSVEEAQSYGKFKLLAEDVGLVYIYPDLNRVLIEGLSFEYLIQSKDVVELKLHQNRKTVVLSYSIGGVQLDLSITPRSLVAELKRQTLGSSQSLFVSMREALSEPVP